MGGKIRKGQMALSYAECYDCGNRVGASYIKQKAPIVLTEKGWIICKACGARWRP